MGMCWRHCVLACLWAIIASGGCGRMPTAAQVHAVCLGGRTELCDLAVGTVPVDRTCMSASPAQRACRCCKLAMLCI